MNKKILLMFVMAFFLVATVSAELITFDNVKNYDEATKTITIKNLFGLGATYAEIELLSPLDNLVPRGYGEVARFKVTSHEDYKNAFKELELFDIKKDMKKFERDYDFKALSIEEYEIDDWSYINNKSVIVGTHTQYREVWTKLTPANFNKDDVVTIGIFTDVQVGDKVEWIPNFFGVKINEWAVWTEGLNSGLMFYYKMDEGAGATGKIIDELGVYNATNGGADNTTGKILSGYNGDGAEFINITFPILTATPYSFFTWTNTTGTGDAALLGQLSGAAIEDRFTFGLSGEGAGKLRYFKGGGAGTLSIESSGTFNSNVYRFIGFVAQANGTTTLYIDGSPDGTSDSDGRGFESYPTYLLGGGPTNRYPGDIDEVGLWNRSLTEAEITRLYNDGAGISYTDVFDTAPFVSLEAPNNETEVFNPVVDFECLSYDDVEVVNVSLIYNGTVVDTDFLPANNTNSSFEYIIGEGMATWTCDVYDNEDAKTVADNFEISFVSDLNITLNLPIDTHNSSSTLNFNGTAVDDTSIVNVSFILDELYNGTETTIVNNTLTNFERTLVDGNYNWTLEACDAYACINSTEIRTFTIDATSPTVNITFPYPNNTEIDFHDGTSNQTINWTALDDHIDACWINYNNTNRTVTCDVNTSSIELSDDRFVEFWSNDTFGNENFIRTYWGYSFLKTGDSFNTKAKETDDESYSINLTVPSDVTEVSSFLNYNGTSYAADSTCVGTACYINSSLDIPLMESLDLFENKSFYWVITTLTGSTTSTLTTDSQNQNISMINFSKCGTGHSAVLFNISKESDQTALVADFDATFKYYLGGGSVIKTETSVQAGASSYDYCIAPNATYIVSSTILLQATGFEPRNFDFVKRNYDNLSQLIQPLRLINSSAETSSNIIIEVTSSGLVPLEGILVNISRYLPTTDSYLLVESQLTDEFGTFVANLVENTVKYKFEFFNEEGTLLKTSDKLTVACRTVFCRLPFVIESETDDLDRFKTPDLYSSTLTFDNTTNTVTFFWDDQTGIFATTKLEVVRYNFNESSTVCENTSTSTLSTIVCGVGDRTATYKVQVFRTASGDDFRIAVLDFKVGVNFSTYGLEGLLWVFILLFTCIGIGAFNPSVGIGLYCAAFIMMGILGVISMPLTVFFANTILCILFIWGLSK